MLSEQEIIRRESLQKLREYGIEPYPASEFSRSHYSSEILDNYKEGEKVIIAGRLLRRKIQGKASFGVIQDAKGKIEFEEQYISELNQQGDRVFIDDNGLRVHRLVDAMSTVCWVIKNSLWLQTAFALFSMLREIYG